MLYLKTEDYKDIVLFTLIFLSAMLLIFNFQMKKEVEKARNTSASSDIFVESNWREDLFLKLYDFNVLEQLPTVHKAKSPKIIPQLQPDFHILLILTTLGCNPCIESEVQNWNKIQHSDRARVLAVGDSGITGMRAYFHSIDLSFPIYVDSASTIHRFFNVPPEKSAVIILDAKKRIIDAYIADFKKEERIKRKIEKLNAAL